ncbi:MAG: hypothetical protein GX419_08400, partial [Bacteroidales bacterium]|nr:hypothetical protein [Bacteroidales bacterium]
MKTNNFYLFFLGLFLLSSCHKSIQIQHGKTKLEINGRMYTRLNALIPGSKPLMDDFFPSEYLVTKRFVLRDFVLQKSDSKTFDGKSGKEEHNLVS